MVALDQDVCYVSRVDSPYVELNLFCMAVEMEVILHVYFRVQNWSNIS